ncbi:MAG: ATP-binding protein [Nanoarchaeota archaeon]
MILGHIIGKTTPSQFSFKVGGDARKFSYVQVMHKDYGFVLCQVADLEKDAEQTVARCGVIGYRDAEGKVRSPRSPFEPGAEVLDAQDELIAQVVQAGSEGAFLGMLEGRPIRVCLDINRMLTKHVAVMAKSGAGKSYAVAVLLEEILERKIPLIVIDPHGEYSLMSQANDKPEDIKKLAALDLKPKGYPRQVQEYGDTSIVQNAKPLRLNDSFTPLELMHILPARLTNTQAALIYASIETLKETTLTSLILALDQSDSNQKASLLSVISYLKSLNLFSPEAMAFNEIVQSGKLSIINLKGIPPEVQEIIVHKLLSDLFEERKKGKIPPFFAVVEEAHNFVPERSYGEAKSSRILRTVASEGRKFGMGLCVVTQRPARVEKNVLSQCTTQIILKVTNPNDLKAISQSVEGITAETEDELKNLPIGIALVTGIVDMPLFVAVRPRKSKHGGEAVDMLKPKDIMEEVKEFAELLPLVFPKTTPKDLRLMGEKGGKITTTLIPAYMFSCQGDQPFSILVEMETGKVVRDIDAMRLSSLPELEKLSGQELAVLRIAYSLKDFSLEDFIVKSGMGLDVQAQLRSLAQKGYLLEEGSRFRITDAYVLSNISSCASFVRIEYCTIGYDQKRRQKANLDKVKEHLSKFAQVVDQKECFIVSYAFKEAAI